jgi:hypothetical protein
MIGLSVSGAAIVKVKGRVGRLNCLTENTYSLQEASLDMEHFDAALQSVRAEEEMEISADMRGVRNDPKNHTGAWHNHNLHGDLYQELRRP